MSTAHDSRVFELRTYYAAPGKFEALHTRFRDHTTGLFRKHGMTIVGFWTPIPPDKASGHTLVYLLAFEDREAAEVAWKAFRADPEWHRVRDASQTDGSLTTKMESVFLSATDYSPLK